jgi:hypothetical protein
MIDEVLGLSPDMLSALAWLWRRVDKLAKGAIRGNSVCSTYFSIPVGAQ